MIRNIGGTAEPSVQPSVQRAAGSRRADRWRRVRRRRGHRWSGQGWWP